MIGYRFFGRKIFRPYMGLQNYDFMIICSSLFLFLYMEIKMVNVLRFFLVFVAFVSVFSCASAPVGEREDANPGLLTDAELEYINSESQDEAMRVFKNNSTSDDDVLRAKSLPALMFSEGYDVLEKRMMAALIEEKGVGIAAPQVGINRRVIFVQRLDKENTPFEIYYNPLITEKRGDMEEGWEGCLSVPDGFGKVMRWLDITVEHDIAESDGKIIRFSENISGFTAIIFQHEIDHLDGVLFIDKETTGELIPKDEYRRMREEEKRKSEESEESEESESEEEVEVKQVKKGGKTSTKTVVETTTKNTKSNKKTK